MQDFRSWKKGKKVKGFYNGETGIIDNISTDDKYKTNPWIEIKRKKGRSFATLNTFLSMGYEVIN